jgi:hypothetical protein
MTAENKIKSPIFSFSPVHGARLAAQRSTKNLHAHLYSTHSSNCSFTLYFVLCTLYFVLFPSIQINLLQLPQKNRPPQWTTRYRSDFSSIIIPPASAPKKQQRKNAHTKHHKRPRFGNRLPKYGMRLSCVISCTAYNVTMFINRIGIRT